VEELRPYLFQHGVALYLNGHDHNAQHIVEPRAIAHLDKRGTDYAPPADALRSNKAEDFVGPFTAESMHYVTVGAGSPIDHDHHHSLSASVPFFDAEGSFARVDVVDKHTAVVRILGYGGAELHRFEIDNPRRKSEPGGGGGGGAREATVGASATDATLLYGSLALNAALLLACIAGGAHWLLRRRRAARPIMVDRSSSGNKPVEVDIVAMPPRVLVEAREAAAAARGGGAASAV